MSDITSLEALKLRARELEMDAVMIRGRVEEIHRLIYEMERRRGGRPRKSAEITIVQREATDTPNGPSGVAGAMFHVETEPPEAAE